MRYYYPNFTNADSESQKDSVTCPKTHRRCYQLVIKDTDFILYEKQRPSF